MNKPSKMYYLITSLIFLFVTLTGCNATASEVTATEVVPEQTVAPTEALATEIQPVVTDSTAQGAAYTVVDALGREIEYQQPPQRIVLAGKALFMIADALYLFPNAGDRIVAMGETNQGSGNFISLIDPDYEAKATLGKEVGAEQIAPLNPDTVILKSSLAETLGSSVEALGIPVVYIDFETPEQYDRDIQILGILLQDEERAAEIITLFHERLDKVENSLANLDAEAKPSTLLLYASSDDSGVAFNVPPMSWIQTQLVELAGGDPVWEEANLGDGWTTVTLEQIAAWDPDYIFIVSYKSNPSEVTDSLKNDPNWQLLRAVQDGKLYAFAFDLYSWDQPDPRWILGLEWLSAKLHPDLFTEMDITTEAQTFYEEFYGLDASFFDEQIKPAFKGDLP